MRFILDLLKKIVYDRGKGFPPCRALTERAALRWQSHRRLWIPQLSSPSHCAVAFFCLSHLITSLRFNRLLMIIIYHVPHLMSSVFVKIFYFFAKKIRPFRSGWFYLKGSSSISFFQFFLRYLKSHLSDIMKS